jgi:hypothetical protein
MLLIFDEVGFISSGDWLKPKYRQASDI